MLIFLHQSQTRETVINDRWAEPFPFVSTDIEAQRPSARGRILYAEKSGQTPFDHRSIENSADCLLYQSIPVRKCCRLPYVLCRERMPPLLTDVIRLFSPIGCHPDVMASEMHTV